MSMDEMKALAKRAVACKGWRWLPGMALTEVAWSLCPNTHDRRRVVSVSFFGHPMLNKDDFSIPGRFCVTAASNGLPDLTDPATLGCLLALVREAWGDPEAYTRTQPRGGASVWTTYIKTVGAQIQRGPAMNAEGDMLYGPTEAHALVAALEAAP